MFNMLLAVACYATLVTILVIFTFPERPGAPLFSKDSQKDTRGTNFSAVGDVLIGDVGNPSTREIGMLD